MADPSQMSQLLEHLRVQLQAQVTVLHERRAQLRASMDVDVEAASQQVASQREVLDSLRYEAELLTEKLLKLRSSRQDIEAELFGLKDKRIQLLDVINKLEDEEMQLVSEVNRIIHYKRSLIKEVPFFEARARASAGLAVVQDYLAASVAHLQQQSDQPPTIADPKWQGTANVLRPAASWASMPATPAMNGTPAAPDSNTSGMAPTPGMPPETALEATAATPAEGALTVAPRGAAQRAAAREGSGIDSSSAVAGTAEAVAQLQLSARGLPQPQQQQQQQRGSGSSTEVTVAEQTQLQSQAATAMEGLQALGGGKTLPEPDAPSAGSLAMPYAPLQQAAPRTTLLATAGSSGNSSIYVRNTSRRTIAGQASRPRRGTISSTPSCPAISSLSSTGSDSLMSSDTIGPTRSNSGVLRNSGSLTAGALGSGSFTSPALPGLGLLLTGERGAHTSTAGDAGAAAATAIAVRQGQRQQPHQQQHQQQQQWGPQAAITTPPPPPVPCRAQSAPLVVQGQQGQAPPLRNSLSAAAGAASCWGATPHQQGQRPVSQPQQQQRQQQPMLQARAEHPPGLFLHQLPVQASPPELVLLVQQTQMHDQSMQLSLPELQNQLQQAMQQQQQQQQQETLQAQQQLHGQQHMQQLNAQQLLLQAQQAPQQQQQQLVLFAEQQLLQPSLGLPAPTYRLTASSSAMDVSALLAGSLPVPSGGFLGPLAGAAPHAAATPHPQQPASQGMWALPPGALLLPSDAPESSTAGIARVLSLQQLHQQVQGLTSSRSSAAAGGGAGAFVGAVGAVSLSPAAGVQPMLMAGLPDAAGYAGGRLPVPQAGPAAEGLRLLQAQQLQQQPSDVVTSLFEHQ